MQNRIAGGDTTCAANQILRLQSVDLLRKIQDNPYYLADGGDELSPRTFVDKINVPTFIGGAFQDEQTGRPLVVDVEGLRSRHAPAGAPDQRHPRREPRPRRTSCG